MIYNVWYQSLLIDINSEFYFVFVHKLALEIIGLYYFKQCLKL